tara:strand:+ start:293 stop:463 length:171 start_codon:yes stop_codon:yes gene_type:complete
MIGKVIPILSSFTTSAILRQTLAEQGFTCNPRAIFEYLVKLNENKFLRIFSCALLF